MIQNTGRYYLYRHIRLDTSEPFYIGIGTVRKKNECEDFRYYKRAYSKINRNRFWKFVVAKTDYEVEILLESDDYEFIKQKEIEFIALYGRRDLGKGTLVNLTHGGDGSVGMKQSKETIEKRIKKLIGKKRTSEYKEKRKEVWRDKIETRKEELVYNEYTMRQGSTAIIINYYGSDETHIKFKETGIERICTFNEVKNGTLKDYFYPSVAGIGYIGDNRKNSNKKAYEAWSTLLHSYKEIYGITKEWHNFQNFAQWYEENYIDGWNLYTNDLELEKGECGRNTCYFIPKELGSHFSTNQGYHIRKKDGAISAKFLTNHIGYFRTKEEAIEKYKKVKKEHILKLTEKYKKFFSEETYNKLVNYKILINNDQTPP